MSDVKFANIIFERNERSSEYPTIYVRSTGTVCSGLAGSISFGAGKHDFTTYFNSLSVGKLEQYTIAKRYKLHLEIRGAACSYVQTRADAFSRSSEVVETTRIDLGACEDWTEYDFDLVTDESCVLVAFVLESDGNFEVRNSYYYLDLGFSSPRYVELALATTTFKKEDYILKNIALVKEDILRSDDPIARHFRMHIVDNGRTLDMEKLSSEGVEIHPNDNVGGAGGFARGMLESMHQDPKATHVLLMDDDVAVSPESIKRTFNLLSILKDEYVESFISGAMINYETGEDQQEDLGFMTHEGFCSSVKGSLRISLLQDIVLNECMKPSPDQDQVYAAWWYCCIPVSMIEKNGLPLPIFVRYDDVEYGLRCKPRFITMNGICIWHSPFYIRYSAAVERYQTVRNSFIIQATTGVASKSDFLQALHKVVQLDLKRFNYSDAILALEGFEDFLKGPDFIASGVAEKCFLDANKRADRLIPFENADIETYGVSYGDLMIPEAFRDFGRSKAEAVFDFVTFNGQRLLDEKRKREAVVIPADGGTYLPGKLRVADTVIAVDPYCKKVIVRIKDKKRFKEIWSRYKRDVKYYKKHKADLEKRYAEAKAELVSESFWRMYLSMD